MKTGWTRATLGEICQVVGGGTPKTSVPAYWGGDIKWATPKDLSDQRTPYISDTGRSITDAGLNGSGARILPAGSVLLSSRAPIGLVAINTVPMATNQGFKSLVPKNSQMDAAFLAYWLSANTHYLQSLGSGATFKEISKAVVEKIELPVPPIDEQRRIARLLDVVSVVCKLNDSASTQALALLDACFVACFGDPARETSKWPGMTIGQIGEVVTGNTPPRSDPANYGDGVGWAKNDDVRDDRLYVTSPTESLSDLGATRGRLAPAGAVLITCISGSPSAIGRAALTAERVAFNQQINAVIPQKVDSRFLCAQMRLLRPVLRKASTGGMKGLISKSSLQRVQVILPPVPMQEEFGVTFNAAAAQLKRYERRAAHLGELGASLQHRAFNGEL